MDAAGVARDRISIEITESVIGSDFDFMKEQVERFQALGFSVWMDDFGSGYSSLDVLQGIKFNPLKFDMGFMRRLDESDAGRTILTELMKMALALGVDTVCEGVETEEQVRFLQEIGCSKLQGFYYCKPVPIKEIAERNRKGVQIGYENPKSLRIWRQSAASTCTILRSTMSRMKRPCKTRLARCRWACWKSRAKKRAMPAPANPSETS